MTGFLIGRTSFRRPLLELIALGVHPLVLSGWQLLVTAVPTAVGALWLAPPGPWVLPSVGTMALILYIALVPMAIGNAAWFAVVGLLPASVAGLSAILVPVVARVVGALVHGEPLGATQWAAMGCCAAALRLALVPAKA